ncbi:23S rRNA (uracil(1939)-C(5))-methyltransferase RlmD [Companilactobacillus mishanensis]|uniref:23S rRNA (Uracil(1939)-C(5))-methyltransferase RlmD n=1 Tax=Companilactobacillus mishanensis TaxID=2486008 RepID=A0A5P0ZFP1_9LACO|nr:23S rRNA (uracil(1939)-C(5))-methyltransferase RlmD [Companilactobacillus mishanensis]MQS51819.1 23S rRNA (uracil(1939)-C(5))-methyltransferase RlmD [Companilactobacillus mishanensis]MQS89064.1 23S rRNA (uracil(1939)-C(5))-methyltransferase RlmD [Companilactobacillus mishanensis]
MDNNITEELNVGDRFPLTIRRIGINGEGIGFFKHVIVFVPGAVPEDVIVCEITEVHTRFLNGKIHKIRTRSPYRNEDVTPLAEKVGGLEFAHIKYEDQLRFKADILRESLNKYKPHAYEHYRIKPTLASPQQERYRNKAQFPIQEIDGEIRCGLYQSGTQDLVDLPDMSTQMDLTMKAIRNIVKIIKELGLPVYNPEAKSGIISMIVIRQSVEFNKLQVTFITRSKKFLKEHKFVEAIREAIPEISSISQNINTEDQGAVWGDETRLIWGDEYLQEDINGYTFNLSPRAFLQLNSLQTDKLYDLAAEALHPAPSDILLDAYCGVGTIGITLAKQVEHVYGIEIIPEAIADAKKNSELNGITNTDYYVGSVDEVYPKLLEDDIHPNAVIVDPPRVGLDDKLIKTILANRPEKFVYISCNPSTLAKDLTQLVTKYRVDYLQPVDMFPQTPHVETIVKLSRR